MKGTIVRKINSSKSQNEAFKYFIRFLKDKGLFHEFFEIMKSGPKGEYRDVYLGNLIYFFNVCEPEYWTTCCFTWEIYNKKGINWGNIHSEWQHTYYTKNLHEI